MSARKALRLFYASGPGDSIGTYRHWKQGRDDPSEPVVAYSGQFYDLCRDLQAEAYVLSTCPRRDELRDGPFRMEHRPNPAHSLTGIRFHLAQFSYGVRLIVSALRFRPDLAVINEGVHWFALTALVAAGVPVVPSLHVRLNQPLRRWAIGGRVVRALNGLFFRWCCQAILVASQEIENDLCLGPHPRTKAFSFLPLYRRTTFAGIPAADHAQRPFNVMYVGRVEANKGALDLVDIARHVCELRKDVHFHVCGTGTAVEVLRRRITEANLDEHFELHGYCNRARLMQMYGLAHVVIVPTRAEIGEGFNQVTAEAVLAGRPAIVSSLCPAVQYVRDAVVAVPPDDIQGYAQAVVALAGDASAYESTRQACTVAQLPFFDPGCSWGACLRRVLADAGESQALETRQPCGSVIRRAATNPIESDVVYQRS